ncbi:DNA methyltransferase [Peribacillus frigoritolerans]
MGSGSTGQAAINLKRNIIGFELDNTYFNKASKALHKDEESK